MPGYAYVFFIMNDEASSQASELDASRTEEGHLLVERGGDSSNFVDGKGGRR